MLFVLFHHVAHHIPYHILTTGVGHEGKRQCQEVGRGGVIAVEDAVGIEHVSRAWRCAPFRMQEALVECFCQPLALLVPLGGIVSHAQQGSKTYCQLQRADGIGCGYQTAVGLACRIFAVDEVRTLGRHTPVTIFVFGDDAVAVAIFGNDVVEPPFDMRVTVGYGLEVAKLPVEHVAGERQGGRPRHVVGIVVPEGRCHIGNAAIGALCLTDVAHPLAVEPFVAKDETLAQ